MIPNTISNDNQVVIYYQKDDYDIN